MKSRIPALFRALPLIVSAGALLCTISASAESLRRPGEAEKFGWKEGDSVAVIPALAREIPEYCFAGCSELRHVKFESGSKLTIISRFAFSECENLISIELPNSVTSIGEGAFRGCRALSEVELPRGLKVIARETFAYCRALKGIKLPAGLTEIKPLAFLDCRSLNLSAVPSGVKSIGNNAFGRCFSIREITLPRRCRAVESYAFADCTSLRRITMPANDSMLGELLFSGCCSLREIIEPSPYPPSIECESFLFEPSDSAAWQDCKVKVPEGSIERYKKSPYWKGFDNIEELK